MSVVIPAHNEAVVLPRLLRELGADAGISVVVSANACTDDTVALARAAAGDGVRVVETEAPSKAVALNAGDAVAGDQFPRAYVDADVLVSAATLSALADALRAHDGPLVAAPRLKVDTSAASWAARAHYRIWELSDYRRAGHVGSGIYALSAEGRARFGAFPDVIADDRFVQQLFAPSERRTIDEEFVVRAPATLRAHIRRATRIAAGNRQLRRRAEGDRVAASRVAEARVTEARVEETRVEATLGTGPSGAPAASGRFGRKKPGSSHPYAADPPIHLPKPTDDPASGAATPTPAPAHGASAPAAAPAPGRRFGRKKPGSVHPYAADPPIHLPKPTPDPATDARKPTGNPVVPLVLAWAPSSPTRASGTTPTRRFGRKNAGPSHPYAADPPIHLPKPTPDPASGTSAPSPAPPPGTPATGTDPRRPTGNPVVSLVPAWATSSPTRASAPRPSRRFGRKTAGPIHPYTPDHLIHLPKPTNDHPISLPEPSAGSGYRHLVARVAPHPTLWPSFLVYCVGYGVPLVLAALSERRGRLPGWNRDESSRA